MIFFFKPTRCIHILWMNVNMNWLRIDCFVSIYHLVCIYVCVYFYSIGLRLWFGKIGSKELRNQRLCVENVLLFPFVANKIFIARKRSVSVYAKARMINNLRFLNEEGTGTPHHRAHSRSGVTVWKVSSTVHNSSWPRQPNTHNVLSVGDPHLRLRQNLSIKHAKIIVFGIPFKKADWRVIIFCEWHCILVSRGHWRCLALGFVLNFRHFVRKKWKTNRQRH
jgi:hypothetical protein